jgi:hypothetical protein
VSAIQLILLSMLVFQVKHFLADFVLQTYDLVRNKGKYLHPAGLIHAGIHVVGSVPALLILTQSPIGHGPAADAIPIAILLVGEFLVHYHTDWTKAQVDARLRLNDTSGLYWAIFGTDQLVHQLTYLGMIYGAVSLF